MEITHWDKAVFSIPQEPQYQGDLVHQLNLLHAAANRLGLYDAADWLAGAKSGTSRRTHADV